MKKKIPQILLVSYIIINILYLLIGMFLKCYKVIDYQKFSYGEIVLLGVNLLIIVLLFILKNYKFDKVDIMLVLMLLFGAISTMYAYNQKHALWGFKLRYEGYFQISYYITLLFLSTFIQKKYKKIIIYVILFTGFIQAVLGLVQVTNTFKNIKIPYRNVKKAKGVTTNSNFYGSYMVIMLSYSIGLFLDSKRGIEKILFSFLTTLFMIGMFISSALSSFVGTIAVLVFITIYCIKNRYIKKYVAIILIFSISFIIISKLNLTDLVKDTKKTTTEISEMTKGNMNDKFGNNRILIWKKTIKEVPKHLLHGIGIDNFYYLLNGKPIIRVTESNKKLYIDKAHNEYLHLLVTQGIFSFFTYLTLYITITITGIKKCFKEKEAYLILPVGGYLVQAFFNFSVIEVAPLFFIACGLLIERK